MHMPLSPAGSSQAGRTVKREERWFHPTSNAHALGCTMFAGDRSLVRPRPLPKSSAFGEGSDRRGGKSWAADAMIRID